MAGSDDLERRKELVSKKYLGVAGIHAVGMSRKSSAVKLYVDGRSTALDEILGAVEKDAAPFGVTVVEAERASARDD